MPDAKIHVVVYPVVRDYFSGKGKKANCRGDDAQSFLMLSCLALAIVTICLSPDTEKKCSDSKKN
ncbi:MAG: hypothetical protein HUK40_19645 [Desulfobacter sp.]|nr:hypothetical protein [Desulfobacter sp.]